MGVRECFIPRPSKVFVSADYPQLELYCLAQVCYDWLGHSALGEMLNKGIDPHTAFAAVLMGISYEEGVRLKEAEDATFYRFRQVAKAFDFGKPGGLGHDRLIELAASKAYKVAITKKEAKQYDKVWRQTFPEMEEYFAIANNAVGYEGFGTVTIPQTGFIRGGARYCALCNTPFQGLGAACAKNAMFLVAQAEYAATNSPLFGSRTIAMIHDEIIAETADGPGMHEAAYELSYLMSVAANEYLPNCPIPASRIQPVAMRKWSKKAFQIFDANKRLVAWNGEKKAA